MDLFLAFFKEVFREFIIICAFLAQLSLSVIHRKQEIWKDWMSVEWSFPRNSEWLLLEDISYFSVPFWSQLVGFCNRRQQKSLSDLSSHCFKALLTTGTYLSGFLSRSSWIKFVHQVQCPIGPFCLCATTHLAGRLLMALWWPWQALPGRVVPEGKRRERSCRKAPWGLTSLVAGWKGLVSMTSNSQVLCFTSGSAAVGGSLILINPKKCISYHFWDKCK